LGQTWAQTVQPVHIVASITGCLPMV
jgi:hypothetical protein